MVPYKPFVPTEAKKNARTSLYRLNQLMKTKRPHIAIQRGEGIGDVLTTTPTIRAIRKLFHNECKITYVTNTHYLDGALEKVLRYNPDIDEVIERDMYTGQDSDILINLHCPCVAHEQPKCTPVSRIDLFAKSVGIVLKDHQLRYYIHPKELERERDFFNTVQNPTIFVQPFASNQRRSVTHPVLKESLKILYRDYGVCSVIVTHSKDWRSDTMWDNLPGSMLFHNADIRRCAALMAHCNMVLCPDSSILHLAAALNIPTVGIFGPTDPKARINHYPQAVEIWGGEGLNPCPCFYSECSIGEMCWQMITPGRVVSKCLEHLHNTSKVNLEDLPICKEENTGEFSIFV